MSSKRKASEPEEQPSNKKQRGEEETAASAAPSSFPSPPRVVRSLSGSHNVAVSRRGSSSGKGKRLSLQDLMGPSSSGAAASPAASVASPSLRPIGSAGKQPASGSAAAAVSASPRSLLPAFVQAARPGATSPTRSRGHKALQAVVESQARSGAGSAKAARGLSLDDLQASLADPAAAPSGGKLPSVFDSLPPSASAIEADGRVLTSLAAFKPVRVLGADARRLSLLGTFGPSDGEQKADQRQSAEEKRAVVLIEPSQIDHSDLSFLSETRLQFVMHNDVFRQYLASLPPAVCKAKVDVIYPCTEKHIAKYTAPSAFYLIMETPEMYQTIHKPFIDGIDPKSMAWVDNLINKRAEVDRLIFEDPDPENGFVLHPDLNWDQQLTTQLHCLAMIKRKGIRSIRDLRAEHIPLLSNIIEKASKAVHDRYGIPRTQQRLFFHYYPSYYHLHVHITHVALDLHNGTSVGRAHLLQDVIANLQSSPTYYADRKIAIQMPNTHPLTEKLLAASETQSS